MAKSKSISELLEKQNVGYLQKIHDDVLEIYLQNGKFTPDEPWFMKDKEGREYIMLPQNVLKQIIASIRKAYEERLRVELERDIISLTPVDFDDVMSVATSKLESLRNKDGSLPHVDTMQLIKEIKKDHPNLFLDFDAILGGGL